MGLRLENCQNIYDIMAMCYWCIKNDAQFDFNDVDFDESKYDMLSTLFLAYLESRNREFNAFYILIDSLISLNKEYVFRSNEYYAIIRIIDQNIGYFTNEVNLCDSFFDTYICLNYELRSKIRIYPVIVNNYRNNIKCLYRKEYVQDYFRKIKTYGIRSINNKLDNYIFMEESDFKDYEPIVHEFLDYEKFTNHIISDKLTIALCPITNTTLSDILKIQYKKDRFYIKGMEQDYENNILRKCKEFITSLSGNIDFLVFPEMIMTENIINKVKKTIEGCKANIGFVIFGSYWNKGDNISVVTYRGEDIFTYYKKIPFEVLYDKKELEYLINNCDDTAQKKLLFSVLNKHDFEKGKKKFKEELNRLTEETKKVHIIDINYFGRIFVFICRDIDDSNYMNLTKKLHADFLFVPACTPSMDLKSVPDELASLFHSTTVISNTCAALCSTKKDKDRKIKNRNRIGFISSPGKINSDRGINDVYYYFDERCKGCEKKCPGRIFTIDMTLLQNDNGNISLKIGEMEN